MPALLVCERDGCSKPLPEDATARRKFCSDTCRVATYRKRKATTRRRNEQAAARNARNSVNRYRVTREESKDGRASARRGQGYERFRREGWADEIVEGSMLVTDVAEAMDTTSANVSRWLAAYREDFVTERQMRDWVTPEEARERLEDFREFRSHYFKVARGALKGKPHVTTEFHMRWIESILHAINTGGQLMILSPPRHGKSLLMAHFVVWQIVRNPDVTIIWVSGNENIAKRFGSLVRDELERNERLIADFCGKGGSFRPPLRSGAQWRDDEFEVGTRTSAQPAPTFKAIGRGGRMLSMDADLIVADDIEDFGSTMQPQQRENTANWFLTDLASRKEEHTAWVYIGSRQHPEDLASRLLESGEWATEVESAHDPDCVIPEDEPDRHVDCVLWPEIRSFRYLMQKKRTVGQGIFDMQYLNSPHSDGMTIFPREMVEACRDFSRNLGDVPPNTRLVAGLDPSGSSNKGYQAAILWAVHVESNTRFVVDIENQQNGGVVHLRSILERWSKAYPGLREWVIEENIVEDTLANDAPLRELKARLGCVFVTHVTGRNKWDQRMGVPGMIPHFEGRRINLPYGSAETRERINAYINQLVNFTDAVNSHARSYKTDLVMAGWFPEKHIQSWQHQFIAVMQCDYARGGGVQWQTEMTTAPWG